MKLENAVATGKTITTTTPEVKLEIGESMLCKQLLLVMKK